MIEAYITSVIAIFLAYIARSERLKFALPMSFIVITVFLSLGYEWGNDVPTYFSWFEGYTRYSLFDFRSYEDLNRKSEFGWVFINQLCAPIGFYGMRAVLFCFENYVIYSLVKRIVPRNYYWFAVLVYTMNPNFMILGSSMMRQWLAMCIVVLAFLHLEKKHWVVYIVLILISFSIHRSSLICLPFIFLPRLADKYRKGLMVALIPFFLLYYFLSDYWVGYLVGMLESDDMYSNYTSSEYSSGVGLLSIIQFFIFIFMFYNIQHIEKNKRIYIAVLMAFGLILPIYNYSGLAARLGYYFTVFTIGAYSLFVGQTKLPSLVKVTFVASIIVLTIFNNIMFFINPMWFMFFGKYTTLMEAGIININL